MAPGHEVAGTGRACGLDEKLAVGTNRLKAVVLDDQRLAPEQCEIQGRDRRPGKMDNVGVSNELQEMQKSRFANYAKWLRTIFKASSGSLRGERDFELRRAVRIAKGGQASGKRKHNGLDAADAGRKEVGIDEQLHSRNFVVVAGEDREAAGSSSSAGRRRPVRLTAIRMASTVAAMLRSGDHV